MQLFETRNGLYFIKQLYQNETLGSIRKVCVWRRKLGLFMESNNCKANKCNNNYLSKTFFCVEGINRFKKEASISIKKKQ